jgi:hypothetical protein
MQEGYLVLLLDSRKAKHGGHGKREAMGVGPYKIATSETGQHTFTLNTLQGEQLELPVNSQSNCTIKQHD